MSPPTTTWGEEARQLSDRGWAEPGLAPDVRDQLPLLPVRDDRSLGFPGCGPAEPSLPPDHRGLGLCAGDLVILPRGDAHLVRDSRRSQVVWLDGILADTPPVDGRLRHGGGGARSELLCGGFLVEQLTARPLLELLPRVVHLHGNEGRAPEWLAGLVRMIAVEMATSGPGSEAVVTRLTDALLAQALRQGLLDADRTSGGSSAVGDPDVARALRLMRELPDRPWSVPAIAAAVAMSRSAFADRFRDATGETPMQHLTRYRMTRAAEYLRNTNAGIREIARRTGYESEVSMSKAFRRQFGTSPGAYRRANIG